jgi:hypothetical protein
VVETDHRHRQRFARTIPCRYDSGDVAWSVAALITLCAGFPPGNLPWVPLDSKPPASKELDVSAATSQIVCNFIGKFIQDFLACRRVEMFFDLERASALLLAPQA